MKRLRWFLGFLATVAGAIAIAILEERARAHYRRAREIDDRHDAELERQAKQAQGEAKARAQSALEAIKKGDELAERAQQRADRGVEENDALESVRRYRERARRLRAQ